MTVALTPHQGLWGLFHSHNSTGWGNNTELADCESSHCSYY